MYLVYADQDGNVYNHEEWYGLGRSGDLINEILPEELIPMPSGATLVAMPYTSPIGMDPETGEMHRLDGPVTAVGALLPQGYTRLFLPGYVKTEKDKALPIFGYTAVVWKDDGFYVAAERSDDPEPWDPRNCDVDLLERKVELLNTKYPNNRLYQHLTKIRLSTNASQLQIRSCNGWREACLYPTPAMPAASVACLRSLRIGASSLRRRG